jgi:hypothetical protein
VNPTAGAVAIVFGFATGAWLAATITAPPGAARLCFALAAAASWVACVACFLLGAQKGRPS